MTWPHEGNDFLLYQVCRALEIPSLIYCVSISPYRSYITHTVEDNPTQLYGAREKGLYDELCSIPQVVLVERETDTYELIKHSLAISTLVGTAGWEALFFGKPYIMFGYWVTQHMPGVYHVRTKKECKAAVDDILRGECQFTQKDIKLFFKAMGDTEGWTLDPDDTSPSPQTPDQRISSNIKLFEQAMGI